MVRFIYGLDPRYPPAESIDIIRLAEKLGFDGCHIADDPTARDPFLIAAAAARETNRIRLGVSATHVYLREPTFIAQALATLDELSGGRAEAVVSFGDSLMLDTYHVEWRGRRPLARLREALAVMRAYLDEGKVDHQGESFHYTGLVASARPVQSHLALFIGAMAGPRSIELAGEVADGVQSFGCSRENSEYVIEHVRLGAERAGRDWHTLQVGAGAVAAVADDPAVAREAARAIAASWLYSYPPSLLERHGIDPAEAQPIIDAYAAGDVERALSLTSSEISAALSIAGTPEECAAKIRHNLVEAGLNHVVLAIIDQRVVDAYGGPTLDGLPDVREQLRLIGERILPAFAS